AVSWRTSTRSRRRRLAAFPLSDRQDGSNARGGEEVKAALQEPTDGAGKRRPRAAECHLQALAGSRKGPVPRLGCISDPLRGLLLANDPLRSPPHSVVPLGLRHRRRELAGGGLCRARSAGRGL